MNIDNLTITNGWKCIAHSEKNNYRVYENWKNSGESLLYFFYDGERKGEITNEPWKNKMKTLPKNIIELLDMGFYPVPGENTTKHTKYQNDKGEVLYHYIDHFGGEGTITDKLIE